MTIKEFARLTRKFTGKNAEIRIYDGAELIETTTLDRILDSEDNFYTLSVVHQVTHLLTGDYEINLEAPE